MIIFLLISYGSYFYVRLQLNRITPLCQNISNGTHTHFGHSTIYLLFSLLNFNFKLAMKFKQVDFLKVDSCFKKALHCNFELKCSLSDVSYNHLHLAYFSQTCRL